MTRKPLREMNADELRNRAARIMGNNPATYPHLQSYRNTVARLRRLEEADSLRAGVTEADLEEYRRNFGESERDAAVRDTNHVLELQSRKGNS